MTPDTSQRIPQHVKLKFDEKHHQRILNGEKTATLRVGMDSDEFPVGHPLLFCEEDGDWFAESEVVRRGCITVETAAEHSPDGHRDYSSTHELIEELRGYYPDEKIGPEKELQVVKWGDIW